MIKSMTGYGKSEIENELVDFDVEIRTVNSRYFDLQIRMPSQFNFLEDKIRKEINSKLKRGRVDVYIKSSRRKSLSSNVSIEKDLALDMKNKLEDLIEYIDLDYRLSLRDILINEDIINFESNNEVDEEVSKMLLSAIGEASEKVDKMRQVEGQSLAKDLEFNLAKLEEIILEVEKRSEEVVYIYKERLEKNIANILTDTVAIDQDRLANEIAFYADKSDINEEIIRLKSHMEQFRKNIESNAPVGKKLDFIVQEMLREFNTIGSKANDLSIIDHIIEGKSLIEKLKEQVQNVE